MAHRDIVVIGGSAGGLDALLRLFNALPTSFQASVFVVLHTHPTSPGYLPEIISRNSHLRAAHAVNDEPIEPGRIYVAPPDHHLVLERERVRVTKGPKENRSRPAIDTLFRSAAYAFGPRVIGVVLSGMLDDGTAGLWSIVDRGGMSIVQSPDDAEFPSMPENALRYVDVHYQLTAQHIGSQLGELVGTIVEEEALPPSPLLEIETSIAREEDALEHGVLQLGELSPYTCPECHGVLVELQEGKLLRYRCHTGHAFSANTLLDAISESIENSYWNTIRGIEESVMLLRHFGNHLIQAGEPAVGSSFQEKAEEAEQRAHQLKDIVMRYEYPSEDRIRSRQ